MKEGMQRLSSAWMETDLCTEQIQLVIVRCWFGYNSLHVYMVTLS